MNISILISTWNNAKVLKTTLKSFEEITVSQHIKWEIVLVNNNCTDDTDSVVKQFKYKLPINYVKEPVQGLSRARNAGLKMCQGELIIFTDDDVKPCKDWINIYWNTYQEKPKQYYFGGPIVSDFECDANLDPVLLKYAPFSVRGLNWGDKIKVLEKGEMFVSANWACPSEKIKKIGGFDLKYGLGADKRKVRTSEEAELMIRLKSEGLEPLYLPNIAIKHFVPKEKSTMKHIMSRKEASGYAAAQLYYNWEGQAIIFGVPKWLYKELVVWMFKCIWKKIQFKKIYDEYAQFRFFKGYMEAVRTIYKETDKYRSKRFA